MTGPVRHRMERGLRSLVSFVNLILVDLANFTTEHTLLVTADGVEVLTARLPNSPGGPVTLPVADKVENGAKAE